MFYNAAAFAAREPASEMTAPVSLRKADHMGSFPCRRTRMCRIYSALSSRVRRIASVKHVVESHIDYLSAPGPEILEASRDDPKERAGIRLAEAIIFRAPQPLIVNPFISDAPGRWRVGLPLSDGETTGIYR